MTTTTERRVEEICPPWCAGHTTDGYQDWERRLDGSLVRDHAEANALVAGLGVAVIQEQHVTGMQSPVVWLSPDDLQSDHQLSPREARELAELLVSAAERAEAGR